MLTPAIPQVNHGQAKHGIAALKVSSPADNHTAHISAASTMRMAAREYLHRRRPRRVLLVSPQADCRTLLPDDDPGAYAVMLSPSPGTGGRTVKCADRSLPFQSRVFDLVLAEHVLCDGLEPFLPEFERVLEGGGQLVILGLGFWSSRYRLSRQGDVPAAIRPLRLCRVLERRDFTIEQCSGAGVIGSGARTGSGWKKPLVGLSDEILIRARSQGSGRIVTPLRFGRARAIGARSAALDGLNREAAS